VSEPAIGYGACTVQAAYALSAASSAAGSGQTVAIVDAYDDPNAVSDLNHYRLTYGLGGCVVVATTGCTFTNGGAITKVNQSGAQGGYPTANSSWGQEISLDLDMVSAVCPNCHILLVEASSNSFANLAAAVNEAAALGATEISNSYGGSEFSGETSSEASYNHPGIAITVSSGDAGYGVQFPAASQYVTAVGGTSLTPDGAGGWAEAAWTGAGSGCSAYEPKPTWQKDTGCARRTVADVSAVADPNTGVNVYDSFGHGSPGWLVFGGTSVASPIIASVYALAGNAANVAYASYPYANHAASQINDVTSGSNGSCGGTYLCTAVQGYDGPTGWGSPNGTGGF
jgi:subtilase family serine protease